jgi:hypothetical protein
MKKHFAKKNVLRREVREEEADKPTWGTT